MILDTSAVIAILRFETEASEFAKIIERAAQRRISAVTYMEAGAVIDANSFETEAVMEASRLRKRSRNRRRARSISDLPFFLPM